MTSIRTGKLQSSSPSPRASSAPAGSGLSADVLTSLLKHVFTIASAFGPAFVAVKAGDSLDLKFSAADFSGDPTVDSTLFEFELTAQVRAVVGLRPPVGGLRDEQVRALESSFELGRQAAQLGETQNFYRRFSAIVHQCFWVLDTDRTRVITVSDNFESVWGTSPTILSEGLTGFMSTVHPGDRDRVLSGFHTGLHSEVNLEFRVFILSGEIRWIWLRGFALSPTQMVLIADDITEKKTEEEAARKRESDLVAQARMQAIGDLASGVAHEINNPLTIIVGKAAEIQRIASARTMDRELLASSAEKIKRTSVRISEIVQSLKSLSRPERFSDRRMQRHPLSKTLQELRDFCSERFQAHGVELILPELKGPIAAELCAEMNPTLITQLLLNLLNNGHDAALNEKEKWVRLDWTEDDDSIYLFVTDSGSGIPIKIRSRIFDPFFTTKDPGQGTGLGLSLASSIATHHHGSLTLDTLHSHTRFTFQLPKKQPAR